MNDSVDYGSVARRLAEIRSRVAAAAARVSRKAEDIEVMAVTKFHPLAAVEAAWEAGIRLFGESRVQEALDKYPVFLSSHPGARLDLIGHLQGNKVTKALGLFDRIQSVDSLTLLEDLDRRAETALPGGKEEVEVLLELHTAEDSKGGFASAETLREACGFLASRAAGGRPRVVPRGLMTMAPNTADAGAIRASFAEGRRLFEELRADSSFPRFDILSMGMSGDFELAVEEGSTLIRLGSALFGDWAP